MTEVRCGCGHVCASQRPTHPRVPSLSRRRSAAFDLNNLLIFGSLPLRQGHHLQGGTVRARPWSLRRTHAHTHLTLTHGPAAHAATNHFACAVPRGQEPGVDEHLPGEQFPQRAQRAYERAVRGDGGCSPCRCTVTDRKSARQDQRGTLQAMSLRGCACDVPCVAWEERRCPLTI
jgi:hypothetical protein